MILIDGDILAYRCSFAVQKERTNQLSYLRYNIDNMMKDMMNNTGFFTYKVFLTGKGNFRESSDISLIPYKGNRRKVAKPIYLQDARDYLEQAWSAEVIDGMEADDALGIYQTTHEGTIIASIDKDLDMIPGWHYNLVKRLKYEISEEEGMINFYKQCLMGDYTTDNIPGLYKMGPKTADKIMRETINHDVTLIKTYFDHIGKDKKHPHELKLKGLTYIFNKFPLISKDQITDSEMESDSNKLEEIIHSVQSLIWIRQKRELIKSNVKMILYGIHRGHGTWGQYEKTMW